MLETWRWERWVMAESRQVTTNLCCVTSEKSELPPVGLFSKYESGWAPEPVWTHGRRQKYLASVGNRTMTALFSSPCPDRYIDYAVQAAIPTGGALTLLSWTQVLSSSRPGGATKISFRDTKDAFCCIGPTNLTTVSRRNLRLSAVKENVDKSNKDSLSPDTPFSLEFFCFLKSSIHIHPTTPHVALLTLLLLWRRLSESLALWIGGGG